MPRNSSLVDSIDLNNAAASQPAFSAHTLEFCMRTHEQAVRAARAARRFPRHTSHPTTWCGVRRGDCGVGAPPRSHEAARDLMTRARFRLERVSVSKNEQSASQACLTLQCTAFEKRPHITSGGF